MPSIHFNNRGVSHLSKAISTFDTEIRVPWADFAQFTNPDAIEGDTMRAIIRDPVNREIVEIDLYNSNLTQANAFLKVVRGLGGTSARAWPAGATFFLSTNTAHYESLFQPESTRQYDFNPNGVISPNYRGEEILQYAGCGVRWWKSFDDSNPYWHLIAGEPCAGEEFQDPGWGLSPVWLPNPAGELFFRDSDLTGPQPYTCVRAISGNRVIVGAQWPGGLTCYFYDPITGLLTHFNNNPYGGGNITALSWDGIHIIGAVGVAGIRTWEITPAGYVLFKDDDYDGPGEGGGEYRDITDIGGLYYCACQTSGIQGYQINGSGLIAHFMTFLPPSGELWEGVGRDRQFAYAVGTDGITSFNLLSWPFLTQVDNHKVPGSNSYSKVWMGKTSNPGGQSDEFIYVAANGSDGIYVYQRDAVGNLTYIGNPFHLGYTHWNGIFDDLYPPGFDNRRYHYVAQGSGGLLSYAEDGAGDLEEKDQDGPRGGVYRDVDIADDGSLIFVAAYNAGLMSYAVIR